MDINFTPFPELDSARLKLRQVTVRDVKELFAMRSNPEVMKYVPRPLAKTKQDVLTLIETFDTGIRENSFINWGITLKDDDQVIGLIGLLRMQPENFRIEVGYLLSPDYHGKGIMTEALKTVVDYAFDVLKFHSLEAVIDPANLASARVLQRHGFVKEAHFIENFYYNGVFLDTVIYSLINRR